MDSKKFNKIIMIFLILQPILDIITAYQIRNNINILSIGTVIRGLFFIFILYYLYKNNFNRKYILLFMSYVFLELSYTFTHTDNSLITETLNIMKIFYLPFLVYFFYKYENSKINDNFILYIYLIYLNLVFIPYVLNLGYTSYSLLEGKKGYLSLFYGGNELSAILIGLLPIILNTIIKSKNYILKLIFYIELIVCTVIIGTKTMFIGVLLVFGFYILRYLIEKFKISDLKTKILIPIIPIVFLIVIFISLPKLPVYNNFKIAMNYYKINSVNDFMSIDSIDKMIFSNRLSYSNNLNKEYSKGDIYTFIYGIGNTKISKIRYSEIDIVDIFYSIGIFGTTIFIGLLYLVLRKVKLRREYKFSFILFIAMSLFSGHVLIKPQVSIYLALLIILNKNSIVLSKKKILLVSNMYPSNKYKFYGSFVKNTKELLENNNYTVDKCVMYKQTNKLMKLIMYIKLHLSVIIKGIFNNYDYIYVHFISHSSMGAVFIKRTSKNVKLILNAHGNDVVADYEFEKKNIKKSKKYLKYADSVVVPSNYFKKVIEEEYKINPNNIYVYPSGGVDTDKFIQKDKSKSKKICNLKEEYKYVGYISRIEKDKGYDIFLKAIKELENKDKIGNKRFLIIGTGLEEDKMYSIIKDLEIIKYLEIRNMVSQDELVDIYNSLDIFVFPTYRKSESLGLVGLEAMSCGDIVIASNNYGPTDYVVNNKNGLLFNPRDYKDLADKILISEELNNEKKNKMIRKARETAIKYDSRNTKNLILDVFK